MPSLTLADGPDALRVAEAVAFVEAQTRGLDVELVHRAALAVAEAVANALEHGAPPVTVAWEPDDALGGWLRVSDARGGPSRDAILRAVLPADPAAEGGRGLFLMRTLADAVGSREGEVSLAFRPRRTCA